MTYEELKTIIEGWLGELRLWGAGGERFRFSKYDDDRPGGQVVFCTNQNLYRVSFHEGERPYLGCMVSSRITRPGETWLRGNDLPDGPFSRETWDKILSGIFAFELVPLDPPVESSGIAPPKGVGSVAGSAGKGC